MTHPLHQQQHDGTTSSSAAPAPSNSAIAGNGNGPVTYMPPLDWLPDVTPFTQSLAHVQLAPPMKMVDNGLLAHLTDPSLASSFLTPAPWHMIPQLSSAAAPSSSTAAATAAMFPFMDHQTAGSGNYNELIPLPMSFSMPMTMTMPMTMPLSMSMAMPMPIGVPSPLPAAHHQQPTLTELMAADHMSVEKSAVIPTSSSSSSSSSSSASRKPRSSITIPATSPLSSTFSSSSKGTPKSYGRAISAPTATTPSVALSSAKKPSHKGSSGGNQVKVEPTAPATPAAAPSTMRPVVFGYDDSEPGVRLSGRLRPPSCAICHSHKVKCDGERPCNRCTRLGRPHMCRERNIGDAKVRTVRQRRGRGATTSTTTTPRGKTAAAKSKSKKKKQQASSDDNNSEEDDSHDGEHVGDDSHDNENDSGSGSDGRTSVKTVKAKGKSAKGKAKAKAKSRSKKAAAASATSSSANSDDDGHSHDSSNDAVDAAPVTPPLATPSASSSSSSSSSSRRGRAPVSPCTPLTSSSASSVRSSSRSPTRKRITLDGTATDGESKSSDTASVTSSSSSSSTTWILTDPRFLSAMELASHGSEVVDTRAVTNTRANYEQWLRRWMVPIVRDSPSLAVDEPLVTRTALGSLLPWMRRVVHKYNSLAHSGIVWQRRMARPLPVRICPSCISPSKQCTSCASSHALTLAQRDPIQQAQIIFTEWFLHVFWLFMWAPKRMTMVAAPSLETVPFACLARTTELGGCPSGADALTEYHKRQMPLLAASAIGIINEARSTAAQVDSDTSVEGSRRSALDFLDDLFPAELPSGTVPSTPLHMLSCNDELERLFGYNRQEIQMRSEAVGWTQAIVIVDPDQAYTFYQNISLGATGAQKHSMMEAMVLTKWGNVIKCLVFGSLRITGRYRTTTFFYVPKTD